MKYEICFLGEAQEDLKHFPPEIKQRVRQAIDDVIGNPWSGEPLIRELAGYWKYRAGRYRIIYKFLPDRKEIFISLIDHRVSVYERLRKMLGA